MSYPVIFSPEAEEQLVGLYRYVAKAASSETAKEFTDAIIKHCEELKSFPQRGTLREDIRPGLRITHFKKTYNYCVRYYGRKCCHSQHLLWRSKL